MEHLEGALRAYPWGSRTLLAELRGTPSPAPTPEAELWFGAHHAAPSTLAGRPLDAVIAEDPQAALGERVAAAGGGELPFLVKLLAAGAPLSIQAHPSRAQAQEGFERENAQGVALGDPRRNYKDPNPKPELITALTEFRALAGFRPAARTRDLFDALGLTRYAAMFAADEPDESIRAVFTTLISLPTQLRHALLDDATAAARTLTASDEDTWMTGIAGTFLQLTERYPGDVGAFAALMLNHVVLAPGEALFLDAGQPHAYLSGLGVEVMANSDNVLRGGLTSKHVDVPELAKVLNFTSLEHPYAPVSQRGGVYEFQLPVDDFQVSRHELGGDEHLTVDTDGPAIVLCTAGVVRAGDFELRPGQAAWIPASDPAVAFTGAADRAEAFYVRA